MAEGNEPQPLESIIAKIIDMNICSDANNINTIGVSFTRISDSTLNTPHKQDASFAPSGCIFNYTSNGSYNVQLFIPLTYNELYIRQKSANTWNPWVKIS